MIDIFGQFLKGMFAMIAFFAVGFFFIVVILVVFNFFAQLMM